MSPTGASRGPGVNAEGRTSARTAVVAGVVDGERGVAPREGSGDRDDERRGGRGRDGGGRGPREQRGAAEREAQRRGEPTCDRHGVTAGAGRG